MNCPSCNKVTTLEDARNKRCGGCMQPMESAENIGEGHYGKALISVTNKEIDVKIECSLCGTIRVGPAHIAHIPTLINMLQKVCDQLGLIYGNKDTLVAEQIIPSSPEELEHIRSQFDKVTLEDARQVARDNKDSGAIPNGMLEKLADDPWRN